VFLALVELVVDPLAEFLVARIAAQGLIAAASTERADSSAVPVAEFGVIGLPRARARAPSFEMVLLDCDKGSFGECGSPENERERESENPELHCFPPVLN
jgi:hypothetical protein